MPLWQSTSLIDAFTLSDMGARGDAGWPAQHRHVGQPHHVWIPRARS